MAIPPICHNSLTDVPFTNCVDCGRELLEVLEEELADQDPVVYQVQKVFVRRESVFEFALCQDCSVEFRSRMSAETMRNMQQFFQEHISQLPVCTPEAVLQETLQCLVCRRPQRECVRYSFASVLAGWALLLRPCPIIICDHCEQRLGELISEETRKEWDRFVEEHFDSPPGVEEGSPGRFPMLV